MDIAKLLADPHDELEQPRLETHLDSPLIPEDRLLSLWSSKLYESGYQLKLVTEISKLTDAILEPVVTSGTEKYVIRTFLHIKTIGRHTNGSFRCHIGMGKASRPILSTELADRMRLFAVFFRPEKTQSHLISPEFILFPTWILHLFCYTQHHAIQGRTDVRFLENAALAKEDHIYRLNHVINTMFRFNMHQLNERRLRDTVALTNYLFDMVGLNHQNLPRPASTNSDQPALYVTLLLLLQTPRPSKCVSICSNCSTKPASRRKLCVACYRYHLKHGVSRPLRLIVANRPGPKSHNDSDDACRADSVGHTPTGDSPQSVSQPRLKKHCANCGVQETHQWYRNLCGAGHWCETCKSYYLRHNKVRPPELFIKAAKRKVNVRAFLDASRWAFNQDNDSSTMTGTSESEPVPQQLPQQQQQHQQQQYVLSTSLSSSVSYPSNEYGSSSSSNLSTLLPTNQDCLLESQARQAPEAHKIFQNYQTQSDASSCSGSSPLTPRYTPFGPLENHESGYSHDIESMSSWVTALSPYYTEASI